jgi:hypothetical protein
MQETVLILRNKKVVLRKIGMASEKMGVPGG